MLTEYCVIDAKHPDKFILAQAADVLIRGGLVAFPTETVYGLGANGLDSAAVARIFSAKGRPADNPLILHIAEIRDVKELARHVPANAKKLMNKYWPGPLTLVLERTQAVPDAVSCGLNTVAIRLPESLVARGLIRMAGVPVAAPSANTSGRPSPTTAQDVLVDLNGKINMVLDAGPCDIGVESTVVDCTTPVPTLLRPGGVTLEMLRATLGEIEVAPALGDAEDAVRSPGMKYTHYAPAAQMILVEGEYPAAAAVIGDQIAKAQAEGKRVGAVVSAETKLPPGVVAAVYGSRNNPEEIAANLYNALRVFDGEAVDVILAESIPETGLGLAVMNRLRKAAGYRIIKA